LCFFFINKYKKIQASHGFEDPDPKFEYPYSIQSRIDSFKRPSEIYDKATQIVDPDYGLENFDLVTPNEHLHNSEVRIFLLLISYILLKNNVFS
jgi:hypothetical protein